METRETVRHPRVLIVDDEPDVCELLRRILSDIGFEVDAEEDGGPAITRLDASRYDLVLLDLMMPVVGGWAVLDHLGRVEHAPPVVVLTARGDQESVAQALKRNIAAYVVKPFDIPVLVDTCRRVVAEAETVSRPTDRRGALRRTVVADVIVYSAAGERIDRGTLVSLGPSGACVLMRPRVEPGRRLVFEVQTLDTRGAMRFEGDVRWCVERDGRHAAGVAFSRQTPDAERQLHELFPSSG